MKTIEKLGRITRSQQGVWRDSKGKIVHGIYHEILKKTEHTIVFRKGRVMAEYVYPRIERTFKSPLLNDYNLHFIGGWAWEPATDRALIDRVENGLKPAAFIVVDKTNKFKLDLLERIAKQAGLITHRHEYQNKYELGVSRKGTFGENFDLKALKNDYKRMGIDVETDDLTDVKISSMLVDWNYIALHGDAKYYLINGLLLGYPVETTVALISKAIK